MSRIRGKDTTPEKRVRSILHRLGYRFRLHVRIPVTLSASTGERGGVRCRIPPSVSVDILLPKHKTAIFVHGCFWHRHRGRIVLRRQTGGNGGSPNSKATP